MHKRDSNRGTPRYDQKVGLGSRLGRRSFAAATMVTYLMLRSPAAWADTSPTLCAPRVVHNETVASAAQRQAAGKIAMPPSVIDPVNGFAWPDTELGVVKSRDGLGYLFFGSDGGCHHYCNTQFERDGSITRTLGSLDRPLGNTAPIESVLHSVHLPPDMLYAGGGPVYRVPPGREGAGDLLLVYQAARATYVAPHHYPDSYQYQNGFWSYLGIAKSSDDGLTWSDLGIIISANQPYQPDSDSFDVGNGGLVMDPTETYFYMYFPDRIVNGTSDTFMSVARAPIDELLRDAAHHRTPRFTKYYNGDWNEPGIGGKSSSVLPASLDYAGDANVVYSRHLKRYVAVFDDTANISYAESPDGICWTSPILLYASDPNIAGAGYAVAVGDGDNPSRLGQRFYIYFTTYGNPSNPNVTNPGWPGASVQRLTIACR
jgi:hypothetical protein